jgi:mono/diheme cytochrome c family protein
VSERVSGNPAAGKAVCEGKGQCLSCHQVNGRGQPVGPDLSAAGSGSAQSLQAAILNPNQRIASAGGVAASREGNFIALDARTGKPLWHFQTGNEIPSSPMSYAVDGKQYVAVSSAGVLFSFAFPD